VANIFEVAKQAGVSIATVSRVLSKPGAVTPTTRRRVLQVIEQLGYATNYAGKQLRTQRSHLIGFISDEIATGPFAGGLIAGAQAAAAERAHALMVMNSGVAGDLSNIDIDLLEDRQTDGLLIATVLTQAIDLTGFQREPV